MAMELSDSENLIRYLGSPWGIAAAVSLLLLLLALSIILFRRNKSDIRRIEQAIDSRAVTVIRDAVIPDGIDGYLFADYLMLLRGAIVVMRFEARRGYIFGGENLNEWTSVENRRTEKFKNPLAKVTLFAQQARHICGFDGVQACVLFGSSSEFPKGVPQGVMQMERFEEQLEALNGSEEQLEAAQQAWARLAAMTHEGRHQLDAVP